jgi:hypothetical protein
LEESKHLRSSKVAKFVTLAKEKGFELAWCDFVTVPQFSTDRSLLMKHVIASRALYEECSVFLVDVEDVAGVNGVKIPSSE